MSHEEIRDVFSDVYNNFYLKNRNKSGNPRSDEEWERIICLANEFSKKYPGKLATRLVSAILEEWNDEDEQKKGSI